MKVKTIKKGSLELYSEAFGQSIDPGVILISGAGAPCRFWTDSFCNRLADQGFFVIRFDLRDSGQSSSIDFNINPYEIADLSQDVLDIAKDWGKDQFHVIGHSMGGYIAQDLAICYPKKVLSLTAISAGPIEATVETEKKQLPEEVEAFKETWKVMLDNKPTDTCETSLPGFMKVWQHLNGDFILDEEMGQKYTQDLYQRSHHRVGVHENHIRVMRYVTLRMRDRKGDLAKIKAPFLVIQGSKDPLVLPRVGGLAIKEACPKALYEEISGMGHMIFNESLERQILFRLASFLKEELK